LLSKTFEPLEGKSKKENKNIFAENLFHLSVELFRANSNIVTNELMRGKQLLVSAVRWQHWSQICFATFI